MFIRRLITIAFAAAFAASSAFALLQSARPALAAPDSNTRIAQQRRDRDDWNRKHRHHNHANLDNRGHHYGQYKPHKRHVDRDRH